jgi:hypothetical protein
MRPMSGVDSYMLRHGAPFRRNLISAPHGARILQGGSSVRIHKRTAVAMSGLVFGGGAALMVGSAASASAGTVTAVPHVAVSGVGYGCRRRSCGRGSHHSSSQRVTVVNHNTNISHSSSNQFQGDDRFRNRRRGFEGFEGFGRGFGGFGGGFGGFGDDDWGGGDDWD